MALGVGYARLGQFDKADAAVKHAKEVAEGGDIIARIDTLIGESMVEATRGNLEAAATISRLCTGMAEEAGATACVVGSNLVLGESLMRQGQFNGAMIALDRSHEVAEVTNQKMFKPSLAAMRRSIAASMGDFNLSGRTYEEALEDARAIGDKWAEGNIVWRRAESERIAAQPDRDKMLIDYAASDSIFADMGARPNRARVLRDWGNALRELDRADQGAEKLRAALELFEEVGLEREAGEVREELAAPA
jgi:tetratricopeptide (TPR) repeat protein